jgi:6-methylsalicylate decarboxylase
MSTSPNSCGSIRPVLVDSRCCLPDVDAAIAEAAYALDTLGLDGVVLLTNLDGRYLGDPALDPLFDELNRRQATIFVHPNVPPQSPKSKLALPGALVEFVFDTTRVAANLIYSGTMERTPDLKIILSHAGGTVPFLAHRLTMGDLDPHLRERAPKGAIAYLKQLYYDVAIAGNAYALTALRELADPTHIVFGSDHPFYPEPLIQGTIAGLERFPGFDEKTRMAIDRCNALALFPRLRAQIAREPQIA